MELIILSAVGTALLLGEGAFIIYRNKKLKRSQEILDTVKEEARDVVQLSLNNPHPTIRISKKGDISFINPAAYKAFMKGATIDSSHPVLQDLEPYFKQKSEAKRDVEFEGETYTQTIVWTQVGDIESLIIYCYNITLRQKYEAELRRAHALAEESRHNAEAASHARGDFLANMSHELRTPMNGIIGLSDLLIDSGLDGENREYITAINKSADNLLILLNDILDFSKIEAGELTLESIPFSIRDLVMQVELIYKNEASKKGIVMRTKVADHVPELLIGDPARLQQILNNLLSNAIKFTDEGTVCLSIDGEKLAGKNFELILEVDDTGIGIPKDKQEKIFDQFQQADASTSRKYGGTGLGLSITKNITQLMNGKLDLQSDAGHGTTFIITLNLPIASANEIQDHHNVDELETISLNTNARILIADDHPINLLYIRKLLHNYGFKNFDEAESGSEAVKLYQRKGHDLILMDCQMPDIDGYEATRRIRTHENERNRPRRATIIAITADAMQGAKEKCMDAGMDDYLSKPIDKKKLRLMLQYWLSKDDNKNAKVKNNNDDNETKDEDIIDVLAAIHHDTETALPVTPPPADTVFDWSHLEEITDGDRDVEKEIIQNFSKLLADDYKILQEYFEQKDYKNWSDGAHKLKGACAHMGATAMAQICDKAQHLPANDSDKIKDYNDKIVNAYERLQDEFEKRLAA